MGSITRLGAVAFCMGIVATPHAVSAAPAGGEEIIVVEQSSLPVEEVVEPPQVVVQQSPMMVAQPLPVGRDGRTPTQGGRWTLVSTAMGLGALSGIELCLMGSPCNEEHWAAISLTAGLGTGAALSLVLSPDEVAPARAVSFGTGAGIGGPSAFFLLGATNGMARWEGDEARRRRSVALTFFLGQIAGAGIGLGIDFLAEPSTWDYVMASSTVFWLDTIVAMGWAARWDRQDQAMTRDDRVRLNAGLFVASQIGWLAGGYLGHALEIDRRGMRTIELTTLGGTGMGLLVGLATSGDDKDLDHVMLAGMTGTIVGLALGIGASRARRGRDRRSMPLPYSLDISPREDGLYASLTLETP